MTAILIGGKPLLNAAGSVIMLPTGGTTNAASGIEIASDRIFQRVGTSKAISFAGVASAPVQIRVETAPYTDTAMWPGGSGVAASAAGGIAASGCDWQDMALNAGGCSAALTVPQGGWYRWLIRDKASGSVLWTSSGKFGVGVLVLLIGQSNQTYSLQDLGSASWPSPLARRYAGAGWWPLNAGDPLVTNAPAAGVQESGGMGRGDGPRLLSIAFRSMFPNLPLGLLEYPVNGSAIAGWQSPDQPQWVQMASASQVASVYGIAGPDCQADHEIGLWLQGEQDALGGTTAASYTSSLTALWQSLASLTGRGSSYKFGVVPVGPGAWNNLGVIRRAHLAFIAANKTQGVFLAGLPADANMGLGDGQIHIGTTDRIRLYRRYAMAVAHQVDPVAFPNGAEGPVITGATLSGSTVHVAVSQSHGTALQTADGASTGVGIGGFRVFVNGTAATIASTTFVGGGINLVLTSAPSGSVTLDYLAADAPFGLGTFPSSQIVTDNVSLPTAAPYSTYYSGRGGAVDPAWTDSRGLPLQPTVSVIAVA